MITKKERLHIDMYNESGIKMMDAHGLYDFEELSTEMVKALANRKIPVLRRAGEDEKAEDEKETICTEGMNDVILEAEAALTLKWRFDGVEFAAEGPAEYVLRASAELLEYLEALT